VKPLEEQLRDHFFNPEPALIEGLSEKGHRIYRRQVRNNLFGGVKRALSTSLRLAGEKAIDDLIQAWLLQAPPQTRFFWELPVEFGTWIGARAAATDPLALGELIQWEATEIAVLNGGTPTPRTIQQEVSDASVAHVHPATRLGVYAHPVHRLNRDDVTWPKPSATPNFIIAYRVGEKMHWLVLQPQAAQLVAKLDEGATVGEGLAFLESLYGNVDRPGLKATLVDLVHRGALLGFSSPA
jgi:hypothetical protein